MSTTSSLSTAFLARFRAAAGAASALRFDHFMALALYDPQVGYYRRARQRVGYAPGTDFFTASTSGPLFGELICAACEQLLGPGQAAAHAFVEIGAETAEGVLAGVAHPFRAARTIRLGEALALSGPCVVFSNELFDAQPFRRFVRHADRWHEIGVRLDADRLIEVDCELPVPPAELPAEAPDGYRVDAPLAAVSLTETLAAPTWTGLFLACDYGKSWQELSEACPAGTARAYRHHQQSHDLLAHPGDQDLTCHVCWDWLVAALARSGFGPPAVQSQESFFIRHAGAFIAATAAREAARFSQRKLSLLQLLHPSHLGQKFQVLHALRPALPTAPRA